MYLGNSPAIGWKREASRSSAEDERASEASSRQGGPCRSELKATGLAGLVIGPLCTFQGVEGG
jgi:hypothetical protein